jgi:hypothetical protein
VSKEVIRILFLLLSKESMYFGSYSFGKKLYTNISIGGGKRVLQYDNSNPISPRLNTISTLLFERNYMKIYEATMGRINFTKDAGGGVRFTANVHYQDRMPLENTTTTKWRNIDSRTFSPNFSILPHQAFITSLNIRWQPGTKFIEFPDRKYSIGSGLPAFNLTLTNGIKGIAGSNVDYAKWRFEVDDEVNLKLAGALKYRVAAGGFFNSKSVFLPDFQHFTGNQLTVVSTQFNAFQLMPYYSFSNTDKFYSSAHIEYHLNGLLTNKIPLFKKLNWFLVTGTNLLHTKSSNNYGEFLIGLENILKVFRVDYIRSLNDNIGNKNGIRIEMPIF